MAISTTIARKDAPAGLATALRALAARGNDVVIAACERAYVRTDSQVYTCANALVLNLDDASSVTTRRGVWGGNNGFNRPPADRAWDPVFDDQERDVPVGGAIVVGLIGRYVWVFVHPTTFAERFVKNDVARDAMLEGRTDALDAIRSADADLSDAECAILYVHCAYKSGEYRKRVVRAYASALESCVARGLIKRAANGACSISVAGKALRDVYRQRGESLAMRV